MAMISVDAAQDRILAAVAVVGTETVALADAGGRTLARPLAALRTQPPAALSAMDGYAVVAAEVAADASFRIVGEAAAGVAFAGRVGSGTAVRIFTGARLPDGADAVIVQEEATRDGDRVRFAGRVAPGANVRPRGIDFCAGDELLKAGAVLTAGRLGLAAAMNHGRIEVARRPRVAILSTGSELVAPGVDAPEGAIVASNAVVVGELVRRAGGEPIDLGIVGDDIAAIRARIGAAIEAGVDVLCVSGGASVGDHDHSRAALAAEGVALDFWRIAMRPGKPMAFGRRGPLAAFCLPGNPVSAYVCGLLYVAPLVRAQLGQPDPRPPTTLARLGVALPENGERRDFLRARLVEDGAGLVAEPFRLQDSSLLSVVSDADALIVRPEDAPAAGVGAPVPIIRL